MLKSISAILLSVVLIIGPALADARQNEQDVTTPCNAHLGSITSTDPHDYERYFERAKVPAVAAKIANQKLANTVALIAIAPVTPDEYKTIFSGSKDKGTQGITESQQREIEAVQQTLKEKFNKDHGDRDFDKNGYKKALQDKKASYVIVMGHNEEGLLRLLDGNTLYLDEIVASARPDQRVILISCDSETGVSNKQVAGTNKRKGN